MLYSRLLVMKDDGVDNLFVEYGAADLYWDEVFGGGRPLEYYLLGY
jgi:hypothetical protein